MGTTYNGHPSWEHWNVSLWIGNDEGLYNIAREAHRAAHGDASKAARYFVDAMGEYNSTETPDGAAWTNETVEAAIEGLFEG